MYKKTGTTQVFEDLELTDFNWVIQNFPRYDFETGKFLIEVHMVEDSKKELTHSRTYPVSEITNKASALNAILSLDQFKNSVAI